MKSKRGLLGRWIDDPRQVGGLIEGRTIDHRRALLLETAAVAEVDTGGVADRPPLFAYELSGRINNTEEQVTFLVLASPDAAAMLVAETLKVGSQAAGMVKAALRERLGRGLAGAE